MPKAKVREAEAEALTYDLSPSRRLHVERKGEWMEVPISVEVEDDKIELRSSGWHISDTLVLVTYSKAAIQVL